MKRQHFRKCCSCRREEEEEPHRSISGPLTESGDTTEYSFKLTKMGWGAEKVDEVGCSLGEMKYSLSAPALGPVGPCFGLKSNAGVWWPPTPPLDTPMNFLEVGALNLGCAPFIKVKKQMMRQNMKYGLLPAKIFPVFS